jgi:hypothetical protein
MWTVGTVVERQNQVEHGTNNQFADQRFSQSDRNNEYRMLAPAANAQPQYV